MDKQGRENIKEFIVVCFDALDTFGKTPEQLGNTVKLFLITLGEYPAPLIRIAFEKWVRTQSKMPTPADIITLIEEKNALLLSYVNRVRETGAGLTQEGFDYIESHLGTDWKKYV